MDHQAVAQLLGNYGEFIGAIGVVVTLAYLALQIRQNTEVARSASRQGIAEAAMAEASSVVENADLAHLLFREISGEKLEDHQHYRLQLFAFRSLRFYENCHYQYRTGMLEQDEWEAFGNNLTLLFELKFFNRYWVGHEKSFTPVFREFVESVRRDLDQAGRLGAAGIEIMGLGSIDRG